MKKAEIAITVFVVLTLVIGIAFADSMAQNCVCASCGVKCGSPHKKGVCIYYPKANEQPAELNLDNCLAFNGCIEKGKICIINGTACCAGTTCKGKFPNTYCN
jgi:hypothetical protein